MSCLGLYLALSPEQEKRILGIRSDGELIEVIHEIEEEWDEEHLEEVGKSWEAIHRTLGDRSAEK